MELLIWQKSILDKITTCGDLMEKSVVVVNCDPIPVGG